MALSKRLDSYAAELVDNARSLVALSEAGLQNADNTSHMALVSAQQTLSGYRNLTERLSQAVNARISASHDAHMLRRVAR